MLCHLCQQRRIVGAVYQHRNSRVILGGCTQHGRPANINILDRHRQITVGTCHRLLKRIQVHDHQVYRRDIVCRHHGLIDTATRKNTAVYFRMQGLDAPVHHLGETGKVGNLDDRNTRLGQQLCGAAG